MFASGRIENSKREIAQKVGIMTRIALAVAALAAVLCLNISSTKAQITGHAPWCAVMEIGAGEVERDCEYFSIEQCVPNVIAGNRGVCQMNPSYRGPPPPYPPPRHHRRHHPPYH